MKRDVRELFQNPPLRHPDHKRPVTRRDFLAQGFLTGAAMVMSPSLFGLLDKAGNANALTVEECGLSAGAGRIPFVCFDLAGGASIAGSNVLVGGQQGQLDRISDSGYSRLGIPADQRPQLPGQVNTELGLAFHADSAFLRGILEKTSVDTRSRINGCVICARSENDTGNNPHNPMYGINRAGAGGDLVNLIGTEPSVSGGNSQAPMTMIDPTERPVKVDRPSDVTGLVDTGKLVDLLDTDDAAAVMSAIEQLSAAKLDRITESAIVEKLVECGYVESSYLVGTFGDPSQLDPFQDDDITGLATSIFDAGEIAQGDFRKTASVMKMVINGLAGAGTVELGGYDYHDSTRATGERKDLIAGRAMGAVLEYAARKGKQLMLYVFSDGSVSSDGVIDNSADGGGKGIWKGDEASTASTFFLVYDPVARPELVRPARQQIGYFRDSGSIETGATRVSNNVNLLAEAIVLNYLALHDEVDRFQTVLPLQGLGDGLADYAALIAFNKIRDRMT